MGIEFFRTLKANAMACLGKGEESCPGDGVDQPIRVSWANQNVAIGTDHEGRDPGESPQLPRSVVHRNGPELHHHGLSWDWIQEVGLKGVPARIGLYSGMEGRRNE